MDMTQQSLFKKRMPLFLVVILSLLFSVSLIAARVYFTEKVTFIFLVWNLFLAVIPFIISSVLILYQHKLARVVLFSAIMLWLLFFPNAPYILTDLFHLKERSGVPLWFDLMVILSAAWNGLILGLLSLQDIQHVISKRFSAAWSWVAVMLSLVLCGFGIYVGRYLRWNSWDVVTNPVGLTTDLLERIANPFTHPRTVGVTILYTCFLLLAYLFFSQLAKLNFKEENGNG
ncbi:MAG: DUF1361 domain-containing protein [Cyclobacteriaceae bacterium]|nr:MAG: DUF1361 domain-containing protein [Cyclobacteriaceae bacterium]